MVDPKDKDAVRRKALRGIGKEPSYEEKQRRKQARRDRAAGRGERGPRRRGWSADEERDDDLPELEPMRRRLAVATGAAAGAGAAIPSVPAGTEALVVGLAPGRARVRTALASLEAELAPDLVRRQQSDVAVGDVVALLERPGAAPRVVAVRPRRSALARPDPSDPRRERVLAANVDLALIVTSAAAPPFRPGLVDRVWIAATRGGVRPLLVVNKLDLLASAAERAALEGELAIYAELGAPVVRVSARTGAGLDELRARLAGARCVLVGHSGVGKSSLLNALDPAGARRTGAVRARDGRGRHTTVAGELRTLGGRAEVVDTPGVRAFGLFGVRRADVEAHFADLAALAVACRFGDCSHLHEPDCAVRAAIERGLTSAARVRMRARLLAECRG